MLIQTEADWLFAVPKEFDGARIYIPGPGGRTIMSARSIATNPNTRRERFYMDINRGRRATGQYTLQLRCRHTTILVRIDVGGPGHPNPDNAPTGRLRPLQGIPIPPPHLHRYVEGFDDAWAEPLPQSFTNPNDLVVTWREFLSFCNISVVPNAQGGLL